MTSIVGRRPSGKVDKAWGSAGLRARADPLVRAAAFAAGGAELGRCDEPALAVPPPEAATRQADTSGRRANRHRGWQHQPQQTSSIGASLSAVAANRFAALAVADEDEDDCNVSQLARVAT